jgi:hypothetical protein
MKVGDIVRSDSDNNPPVAIYMVWEVKGNLIRLLPIAHGYKRFHFHDLRAVARDNFIHYDFFDITKEPYKRWYTLLTGKEKDYFVKRINMAALFEGVFNDKFTLFNLD